MASMSATFDYQNVHVMIFSLSAKGRTLEHTSQTCVLEYLNALCYKVGNKAQRRQRHRPRFSETPVARSLPDLCTRSRCAATYAERTPEPGRPEMMLIHASCTHRHTHNNTHNNNNTHTHQ